METQTPNSARLSRTFESESCGQQHAGKIGESV
jgi:hypothetical protein